jgi:hypothetical protein
VAPADLKPNEENEIPYKDLPQDMTLIAITSIPSILASLRLSLSAIVPASR